MELNMEYEIVVHCAIVIIIIRFDISLNRYFNNLINNHNQSIAFSIQIELQ